MFVARVSFLRCLSGTGAGLLFRSLILVILFSAALRAEQVVVTRDGTLVFQEASAESSVLSILPRGVQMDVVKRGDNWCEVMLPESRTRGFVRTDALDTFAGATVRTQPLDDSRRTTPAYGSLRAKLDKSDAKIKKIEESLDQLEKNVRMFIEAGYAGPALKDRKRLEKQREAVPRRGEGTAKVRPFGVNMFSGLYFDAGDFTAGLALTYIPDVMKGFGLECEAGYIGMAGAQEGLGASLNLLYLPDWGNRVFIPYFAAGAGIIYTSNAGAGLGKQTDPAANLGGGVFFPMSNKFSLRADARLMCRFEEDTKKVDGRFYLALHCGF